MLPGLKPYKIDIEQGNYLTQDMVSKLKPGMTRSQVRYLLGTPLIADPFHADRWDYVFLLQKAGKVAEYRRVVVIFKDDKLDRVEGDVVPETHVPHNGGAPAAKDALKAAPSAPAGPAQAPRTEQEGGK